MALMRQPDGRDTMGLLRLLLFPLTGPMAVAELLKNQAEQQLYDQEAIRQQMGDLERQLGEGQITREEFDERFDELFERLMEAREYHQQVAGQETI